MRNHPILTLLALGGATAAVALLGTAASREHRRVWYRSLDKPRFTPPFWVFGAIWPALYGLMTASAWRVSQTPPSRARTGALASWAAQLALNGAWSPLFFGGKRKRLALADAAALVPAIGAYSLFAGKVDKPAAWMMLPYLGWSAFATALNAGINKKN